MIQIRKIMKPRFLDCFKILVVYRQPFWRAGSLLVYAKKPQSFLGCHILHKINTRLNTPIRCRTRQ